MCAYSGMRKENVRLSQEQAVKRTIQGLYAKADHVLARKLWRKGDAKRAKQAEERAARRLADPAT